MTLDISNDHIQNMEIKSLDNATLSIPCTSGEIGDGGSWTVYSGDAISVMRTFPKSSFNCVVTSPPYFWLRDYSVDNQIGQEETVQGYVTNIASVMSEVYRVLKPDGVVFLNIGDTYYSGKGEPKGKDRKNSKRRFGLRAVDKGGGMGIGLKRKTLIGVPWRVALELMQRQWILRSSIIWVNDLRTPEPVKDRPRQHYEYVFMLTKSRRNFFDRNLLDVAKEENVWRTVTKQQLPQGVETAPFPDELVSRCLELGCPADGTVLDPFAGSGTTVRVAATSGRKSTGIELNHQTYLYMLQQLQRPQNYTLSME